MINPEEFETAFQLMFEREERWGRGIQQAGYEFLVHEVARMAGPLPAERMQEIVNSVSSELDKILCANPQHGRELRHALLTDDEQDYSTRLNAAYRLLIPELAQGAVQKLNLQAIVEPEKEQVWIQ